MHVRIEGVDLPGRSCGPGNDVPGGYRNIHVGIHVKGPYIQGPPGGRFIYLNWVTIDDAGTATLFRRAKLWLDGVPPEVLAEAGRTGLLVGRLGLTDPKGNPTCSAGRPPTIEWSAGTA